MPVFLRKSFRIECADKKGFVIFNSKGCCVKNSKKTDEIVAGSALANMGGAFINEPLFNKNTLPSAATRSGRDLMEMVNKLEI